MSYLIIGTKTSGADLDFLLRPLYHNCCAMNIRQPFSPGMPFRVTYLIPEHGSFATNFTLHCRLSQSSFLGTSNCSPHQ